MNRDSKTRQGPMCGILCCITPLSSPHTNTNTIRLDVQSEHPAASCPFCLDNPHRESQDEIALTNQLLRNRGPDTSDEQCIKLPNSLFQIHLSGHVLWTQGSHPVRQPMVDGSKSKFLLFNGDIYSFGDNCVSPSSVQVSPDTDSTFECNDGQLLFEHLTSDGDQFADQALHVPTVLRNLQGPFVFIFYDQQQNQLWFGRDFFGRQSLLISVLSHSQSLIFSSVSALPNTLEVPTSAIFCYNLVKNEIVAYLWKSHERKQISECTAKFCEYLQEQAGVKVNMDQSNCIEFGNRLLTKLKPPTTSDSDFTLEKLMNISSHDLVQALEQVTEILSDKISQLLVHLRRSIERRVLIKPPYCKICIGKHRCSSCPDQCSHSKIGILFSGGLDSMVLTYLTAEILAKHKNESDCPESSIDLINVAFFQDEHLANLSTGNESKTKVPIPPDRITGLEAHSILYEIFKPRGISLNFIQVNVPKSRVSEIRESKLRHLISPLTSVLDDSVGCCLWFASEATSIGLSNARILLLGSGADELFGGYGRHRSAYESKGWIGLKDEMQMEIDRISLRNMGRDNRVVADHGVAPRLPFLDEEVIRFVTQECHIWEKCCPLKAFTTTSNAANGETCHSLGDKILLRATALQLLRSSENYDKNGVQLALFPKRAMQFGSRIAKLENSKEKGGDECRRLRLIHK